MVSENHILPFQTAYANIGHLVYGLNFKLFNDEIQEYLHSILYYILKCIVTAIKSVYLDPKNRTFITFKQSFVLSILLTI